MESQLLKKGCKAFHNLVTTYLFRSPLPAMGFSTGYFSSLKQATDATTFLPFTWKTPRDSSFSVCVCGADTLWAASRPLEEGWRTGLGSGVKETSLHCGCTTPYVGRLGKLPNHSEPQFPPPKANNI